MLSFRVIACLDVQNGRVVKGVRFSDLQDMGDPAECAQRYAQDGADELVLLDISATREERDTAMQTVARVRSAINIPLCVGGGIRSLRQAEQLLVAGADKVAINSAAVADRSIISRLSRRFGRQCVVASIDARPRATGGYEVVVRSGSEAVDLCPIDWARELSSLGAGELLITAWHRDGTGDGYDIQLLESIRQVVKVPIIASGGASRIEHLVQAHASGAQAALLASRLHSGKFTVADLKTKLAEEKVAIRK